MLSLATLEALQEGIKLTCIYVADVHLSNCLFSRTSEVTLKCTIGAPTFAFNEEKPQYNYVSKDIVKYACL